LVLIIEALAKMIGGPRKQHGAGKSDF